MLIEQIIKKYYPKTTLLDTLVKTVKENGEPTYAKIGVFFENKPVLK